MFSYRVLHCLDRSLRDLRSSKLPPEFKMRLPDDLIPKGTCKMSDLNAHVYPNLRAKIGTIEYTDWVCKRAIVCWTNDEVDAFNKLLADQLPGESVQYPGLSFEFGQTNFKIRTLPDIT